MPLFYQHGAPVGVTIIRQVHMWSTSTVVWAWRQTCVKCGMVSETSTLMFAKIIGTFGCKNRNTPKWSSTTDNSIIWGGIGSLGSPFYICGGNITLISISTWSDRERIIRLCESFCKEVYVWKFGDKSIIGAFYQQLCDVACGSTTLLQATDPLDW